MEITRIAPGSDLGILEILPRSIIIYFAIVREILSLVLFKSRSERNI